MAASDDGNMCEFQQKRVFSDAEGRTLFAQPIETTFEATCRQHIAIQSANELRLASMDLISMEMQALDANVRTIDLSHNQLDKFYISRPTSSLQRLYLSDNPIASFQNLTIPSALKTLGLDWTEFSSFGDTKFPDSLEELDISYTNISSLRDLHAPSLKRLTWQGASLRTFDQVEFPWTLTELNLDGNSGVDMSRIKLPENCIISLRENNLTSLAHFSLPLTTIGLNLDDNNLMFFPKGINSQFTALRSLSIARNSLAGVTNTTLPPALERLSLPGNHITEVSGVELPSTLQELDLTDNAVTQIELPERNLQLLERLVIRGVANAQSSSCRHPRAKSHTTQAQVAICVLPNAEWDVLYTQQNTSASRDPTSDGMSGSELVGGVFGLVAFAFLVIAMAIWIKRERNYRRSRARRKITSVYHRLSEDSRQTPGIWSDPAVVETRINLNLIQPTKLLSKSVKSVQIYRGTYASQDVAIKRIQPEAKNNLELVVKLMQEIKIIAYLQHPNVVGYIGVAWDALADLCVVYEYMPRGSLHQLLVKFDVMGLPKGLDREKIYIAKQIATALQYLHSLATPVVHRQLTSHNVMLNEQMEAKVCNFGIPEHLLTEEDEWGLGPDDVVAPAASENRLWVAPEVLMGNRFDERADVYSFGIVLSEIDSNRLPFEEVIEYHVSSSSECDYDCDYSSMADDDRSVASSRQSVASSHVSEDSLVQMVSRGHLRVAFSSYDRIEEVVSALGTACVSLDPDERPTAQQIAEELTLILRSFHG